jgi:putative ATP-binding cassette transporter
MRSIDRRAWSRWLAITTPFFTSEDRRLALTKLGLLLALLVLVSVLNVVNSYVGRDFMSAIASRDGNLYIRYAWFYLGVFAAQTAVAVFARFAEQRLGLAWRQWLTHHLFTVYLANNAFNRLRSREDIDNPDQRITDDVRVFTTTSLSFILILLNTAITIIAFAGVLWSITPWLFLTAVAYAAVGSLLTVVVGRQLVGLNMAQLKKEADFRYELIRVREHAEPVALLRREQTEGSRLDDRLHALVDNFTAIIYVNRNLGFFTNGYNYLIQITPVLIVAPLYVRGAVEFGVVTQSMMAFSTILGAFSLVVVQFQQITEFAAVVTRLGTLWDALHEGPAGPVVEDVPGSDRVAYENLTLRRAKDDRLLVGGLTVTVPAGHRLLIRGPNEAAAGALVRATAGLWRWGEGRIVRPGRDEVMFIPQYAFTALGSLRDQLVVNDHHLADDLTLAALREVGLGPLVEQVGGLDVSRDWSTVLSERERQTLAFARMILSKPRFVFLDYATDALDPGRRRHLYDVMRKAGMSYITAGDTPDLADYHDMTLVLKDDGQWDSFAADAAPPYAAK